MFEPCLSRRACPKGTRCTLHVLYSSRLSSRSAVFAFLSPGGRGRGATEAGAGGPTGSGGRASQSGVFFGQIGLTGRAGPPGLGDGGEGKPPPSPLGGQDECSQGLPGGGLDRSLRPSVAGKAAGSGCLACMACFRSWGVCIQSGRASIAPPCGECKMPQCDHACPPSRAGGHRI